MNVLMFLILFPHEEVFGGEAFNWFQDCYVWAQHYPQLVLNSKLTINKIFHQCCLFFFNFILYNFCFLLI